MTMTQPDVGRTLPAHRRAAYIERRGPAEEIHVGPLDLPTLGPDDVLVRVSAAGVNHVDTFVRSGAYPTPVTFPFVIGRDLTGVVVRPAAGSDPALGGFAAGEAVWCNSLGHDGRQGSCAEFVAVAAERLYRLPAGADPVAAVAVVHTAATAHLGLVQRARLRPGETVVVTGAGSGVGTAVIQLAVDLGARVIGVDRADNHDWCRRSGAHVVLDRADPGLGDRLGELAPGGVQVFWDCTGRPDLDLVVPLMARGGRIVLIAGLGARPVLPLGRFYLNDLSLWGFVISNASVSELTTAAATVNRGLAAGWLRGRIGAVLPLTRAADAHRLIESGATGRPPGRIVLIPSGRPVQAPSRPSEALSGPVEPQRE